MTENKVEEAEEPDGMRKYYFASCLLFGALSLYCFLFQDKWGNYTCLRNVWEEGDESTLDETELIVKYCYDDKPVIHAAVCDSKLWTIRDPAKDDLLKKMTAEGDLCPDFFDSTGAVSTP